MITHAQLESAMLDHAAAMQARAGDTRAIVDMAGFENPDEALALRERFIMRRHHPARRGHVEGRQTMMLGLIQGLLMGMRLVASRPA